MALSTVILLCMVGSIIWFAGDIHPFGRPASRVTEGAPSPPPASPAVTPPGQDDGTPSPTPEASVPGAVGGAFPSPKTGEAPEEQVSSGESRQINMAFVGDVIFASTVETILKKHGYDYPYRNLREELLSPDITVANLETPVTVRGEEQEKQYVYRSHPDALSAFREAGFDVVNLANNHIMDYGVEGLLDTLEHLDQEGILRTGAGKNIEEAYKPAIVEKNGMKVAFLGFSHKVPEVSWKAGINSPGTTQLYDAKQEDAMKAIGQAREQADLVVVIAHWGIEREDKPQDIHRNMAKAFIDAGADLIIGGHPHVLQGFEMYKGKWIAYSLGNFLFTTNTFPASWETVVLNAACSRSGECDISLVPVENKYANPVPMEEEAAKALFQRLTSISFGVRINEKGQLAKEE